MRVVVLRALGLGDLLTAVPALRGVRRAHPDADVVLLGPRHLAPLLPTGLVDDVRHLSMLTAVADDVALDDDLSGADLAVNLHGRGPQSTALLATTRPQELVAFERTTPWDDDEHEVARWCRLVTAAGMPADPADLDLPAPGVPPPVAGGVVVHPGAALPARRWPVERWAQVARGLHGAGHRVVVTGGLEEVALASAVAAAAGLPDDAVLAGRTSPLELAALVAASRLLLAPDTGVAHLATALRTPSVVLFGPVPPSAWGPPADRPWHRALWAGRRGDGDAPTTDPGLLALTSAQVLDAATALLAREAPRPGPAPDDRSRTHVP